MYISQFAIKITVNNFQKLKFFRVVNLNLGYMLGRLVKTPPSFSQTIILMG